MARHNFCGLCMQKALPDSARCPICRAPVPHAAGLKKNFLLARLIRASDPDKYDARAASIGAYRPSGQAGLSPRMRWRLFVDYVSPACQVVLALARRLDVAADELQIVEQHMTWCDASSRARWSHSDAA